MGAIARKAAEELMAHKPSPILEAMKETREVFYRRMEQGLINRIPGYDPAVELLRRRIEELTRVMVMAVATWESDGRLATADSVDFSRYRAEAFLASMDFAASPESRLAVGPWCRSDLLRFVDEASPRFAMPLTLILAGEMRRSRLEIPRLAAADRRGAFLSMLVRLENLVLPEAVEQRDSAA